ncbi:putative POP1-like ribonuclease [Hamiltosporidium tvaerminnensis]|uniref:Putative POP1-like ribonuclease n=2 Tax=Hamiltosporidium tvaerminnensis TaxID=1176355 RepID=A0A4Q9L5D4_9MICR|nr:Ribonucleases P/MRP protein subunit pop1 [Hamiltosporidium tvaerminnensis]TBU02788.1 putative POP1-like ribonuclease [Hamiltosporidium tvaerminnensis]
MSEQEKEIDALKFITAREFEIKEMEDSLSKSTKKSQLFQRLPFYKRRRTRNYDTRNTPKIHKKYLKKLYLNRFRNRKLKFNYLPTHIWYAKRFKMIDLFNSKLPYKRNIKSDKFIYKSLERGFIFDESFKRIAVFKRNEIGNREDENINTIKSMQMKMEKKTVNEEELNEKLHSNIQMKIETEKRNEEEFNEKLHSNIQMKIEKETVNEESKNGILKSNENKLESARKNINIKEEFVIKKYEFDFEGKNFIFESFFTKKYFIIIYVDCLEFKEFLKVFSKPFLFIWEGIISVIKNTTFFSQSGIYQKEKFINFEIDEYLENYIFPSRENEDCSLNETEDTNDGLNLQKETKTLQINKLETSEYIFIKSNDSLENGKIILRRKYLSNIFHFLINKGIIPISILELFRLGIECKKIIHIFDNLKNSLSLDFHSKVAIDIKNKDIKRPISKRINQYEYDFTNTEYFKNIFNSVKILYFEALQGCIERNGIIFQNTHQIGLVIRGSFCFTSGKSRGLCFVTEDVNTKEEYFARNFNSTKMCKIIFLLETLETDYQKI